LVYILIEIYHTENVTDILFEFCNKY